MGNVALRICQSPVTLHLLSLPCLMAMGRHGDCTAVAFNDKKMTPEIERNSDQRRNRCLSSDIKEGAKDEKRQVTRVSLLLSKHTYKLPQERSAWMSRSAAAIHASVHQRQS